MYAYNLEKLMLPKIEEVIKVIKIINEQHTTSGTYEGRLSDGEALWDYRLLLNLLDKMDNLSVEVKDVLRKEVQDKMDSTAKVEEEKRQI